MVGAGAPGRKKRLDAMRDQIEEWANRGLVQEAIIDKIYETTGDRCGRRTLSRRMAKWEIASTFPYDKYETEIRQWAAEGVQQMDILDRLKELSGRRPSHKTLYRRLKEWRTSERQTKLEELDGLVVDLRIREIWEANGPSDEEIAKHLRDTEGVNINKATVARRRRAMGLYKRAARGIYKVPHLAQDGSATMIGDVGGDDNDNTNDSDKANVANMDLGQENGHQVGDNQDPESSVQHYQPLIPVEGEAT
ncbi:Hypothetical protein R9X50_00152000 [Acrodontium crateriforme]|uniref:Uncharacterized protein n=1 Tax=Acrodontium crateriforme TaxID=150365 RepID=A0AAQ3M5C0_9PEZI|nr:Hypothetical protein R9X50_00152000 [Acrodontium crateriforme]